MKPLLAVWLFFSSAAVALLGCGGGSSASVPVDQFAAQYSQAMCAQNFKCCSAADIDGRTMQECTETNSSVLSLVAASISQGQAAGRLSYDGAQMGMCIAALKQMSCDQWKAGMTMANQPASCHAALTARVTAGGACLDDNECTTGHCEGSDSSVDPPVTGMCTALVAAGGSCATAECADGLYCPDDTRICTAQKAAGQTCTSDEQCVNTCNTTTGLCSCYAGCAVAGALPPRPPLLALALLGVAILYRRRRRPPV